mgnify:FL=1
MMFRIVLLLLALVFSATPAAAQNPTCPTRPSGDTSNACASTAFVNGMIGAIFTTPHTWTQLQSFSTTTASRSVNTTSNGALLSSNIGPAGLALWPYDNFATINYQNFIDTSSHVGASYAAAGTFTTFTGSTANGPTNANVAHLFGCQKLNYLTSTVEGESDCIYLALNQGAKGDGSLITGGVQKVQGSGSDTGSALAFEFTSQWINSSAVVQKDMHILGGFQESLGGVSNNGGYGYFAEAWKGALFSAFFAGTYDGYTSTHTWDYVTYATYDRSTANRYYAVRGNGSLTGSQQPGEIIQGAPTTQKILRTNADGSWTVRNTADDTDLLKVTNTGGLTWVGAGNGGSVVLTANSSLTRNVNAAAVFTITNSNAGASAAASYVATTTAGSVTLSGNGPSAYAAVQSTINGTFYFDSVGAAAGMAFRTGATPTTALTISASQVLQLPVVTTGVPAASLCIDASGNIIKKTTAGACI